MIDDLTLHVGEVECIGGCTLKSRAHAVLLWIELIGERDLRGSRKAFQLSVCFGVVRHHMPSEILNRLALSLAFSQSRELHLGHASGSQ
jgi:hypothetical protein